MKIYKKQEEEKNKRIKKKEDNSKTRLVFLRIYLFLFTFNT